MQDSGMLGDVHSSCHIDSRREANAAVPKAGGLEPPSASNWKVYAYILKHNYVLGGMLFTIRKAQIHVLATNFGHHQVVQW